MGPPAPTLNFQWTTQRKVVETLQEGGRERRRITLVTDQHDRHVTFQSTDVDVVLGLDERLKGLLWYSLYNVKFDGHWKYVHSEPSAGTLNILFRFPDQAGLYDAFRFVVDGKDLSGTLKPQDGQVKAE